MNQSKINIPALNKPLAFSFGLVAGLLIRIVYAVFFYRELMQGDASYYYECASLLAQGQFPGTYWPPGMAFYLAPWLKVIGVSPISTILAMLGVYVLFIRKFYLVAHRFLELWVVNLGVILFAVYPAFIHHSVAPLSHLPIALILIWVADELWKIHSSYQQNKGNWHSWIMIGLLVGIGTLIRPGVLFILPIIGVFAIWQTKREAYRFLASLFLISLFIGGWQGWVYYETGRKVMFNDASTMNMYLGNNPYTPLYRTWWLGSQDERENPQYREFYPKWDSISALPQAEQSSIYRQKTAQYIKEAPELFILRSLNRVRTFYAFDTFTGAKIFKKNRFFGTILLLLDAVCFVLIGLLAIWGMIGRGTAMPYKVRRIWLWLILVYGIPYFLAFSHPTYHLPIMPILIIFAGSALTKTEPKVFSFRALPVSSRPFVYAAFLLFLYTQFEWIAQMIDRYVALGGGF